MGRIVLFLALFSVSAVSLSQAQSVGNYTYRGDINEDSQVNIFDLLEMLKMLGEPEEQPERSRQIGDMDENEAFNIFDLLALRAGKGNLTGNFFAIMFKAHINSPLTVRSLSSKSR